MNPKTTKKAPKENKPTNKAISPNEGKRVKDCPHCFEEIFEKATTCHHCREHIGHFWWLIPRYSIPIIYNLIAAFAISYAFFQPRLEKATQEVKTAQNTATQAIGKKNAVVSDANKANLVLTSPNIPTANLSNTNEESFENSVLLKTPGIVHEALSEAFYLKNNKPIKFIWGGKSPDEGFDSSGFISFVLSKEGVLDSFVYQDFSSQKLKDTFEMIDPKVTKIGDILIYKTGLVLFYLGENKGLGIGNSSGIKIFDVDPTKNWDVRRWEGQRVLAVTDNQGRRLVDNNGNTIITIESKIVK